MSVAMMAASTWVALLGQPDPTAAPDVPTDDVAASEGGEGEGPPEKPESASKRPATDSPKVRQARVAALRAGFRARVSAEVDLAIAQRAAYCGQADEARNEQRFAQQRNNEAAGANALNDGPGTSTGAERLAAAVNTGIDGVEAGVVLAPLALVPSFTPKTPQGPSLLLAALKDGKVRAGAGYSVTLRQPVNPEKEWRANSCADLAKRDAATTKLVEQALGAPEEGAYVSVCLGVSPHLDTYVASACGDSDEDEDCKTARARRSALVEACDQVDVQTLSATTEKLLEDENAPSELHTVLSRERDSIDTLRKAGTALVTAKIGSDTEGFVQRYREEQWRAMSVRLGVDGSVDFARRQFGKRRLEASSPGAPGEPEELDGGELLGWRVGPAVLLKAGRAQSTLGVNGGQGMPVGAKAMFTTLEPSASFSWLVAFLDAGKADASPYRTRPPKFDDEGNLPPHVVLGARASVTVPITQPTFQDDTLNAATFLAHADFIVTKALKFRLGVPVTAELVEQEANTDAEPDIPKRTVLRWTIPVFATTVLAF